ncbi:MAG: ribosomal protein S18-alanine N-acetyltransferase [Defluviitaleaceae bacterium]|nr:ribosomal protein S18-alanine N-acetyltransferase [Defluviitaleaceae bacterium]
MIEKITIPEGFIEYMIVFDTADIINIEVLPKYRRKGIATSLLKDFFEICNNAKTGGVSKFFLEVRKSNENAINLYIKNGFEVISERKNYYKKPTENALVMIKNIKN